MGLHQAPVCRLGFLLIYSQEWHLLCHRQSLGQVGTEETLP